MTNCLMAALADADEIAFPFPIGICVVNIQRQLRSALNMIDVVDHLSATELALGFAELTFVVI